MWAPVYGREQEGTHKGYPYIIWALQIGGEHFLGADAAKRAMYTEFAAYRYAEIGELGRIE